MECELLSLENAAVWKYWGKRLNYTNGCRDTPADKAISFDMKIPVGPTIQMFGWAEMFTDSPLPLPQPKKPTKFTLAALRIMRMCEKAFASNNFLLMYFSNRKMFTQEFNDLAFREALKNKFQFLQLNRADRAGN
jgi:hypothetical protein